MYWLTLINQDTLPPESLQQRSELVQQQPEVIPVEMLAVT